MTRPPALARSLDLSPHPEGGWYRRIYTSPVTLPHPTGGGTRASATLIHYLLAPGEQSQWHKVASDEVWLWQQGGPLLLRTSPPGPAPGALTDHLLDPLAEGGGRLHAVVPAGHWQRAEPAADREVLVTCMVTPGFDFADFALLQRP
jgi:predicted cupin superfamily sugar epimerase